MTVENLKKNVWLEKQERNEEGNVEKQSQKRRKMKATVKGNTNETKEKWGQFMDKRGKTRNNKMNN